MKKLFEMVLLTTVVFVVMALVIRQNQELVEAIELLKFCYKISEQMIIGQLLFWSFMIAAFMNAVYEIVYELVIDIFKGIKFVFNKATGRVA